MNNSKIFIIRHGETDYNLEKKMQGRGIDAPLNDTGRSQAQAVANYLEKYHLKRVISSSMLRARQSAEPIVRKNGTSLLTHEDLDEMNFGEFEGKGYQTIDEEVQKLNKKWMEGETFQKIPGGESPQDVLQRASSRVFKYLEEFEGDNMAFIVHGRVIRILLSEWTGLGLNNMHRIYHTNGAINHLLWSGGGFEVVYLNKTDHLIDYTVRSTGS